MHGVYHLVWRAKRQKYRENHLFLAAYIEQLWIRKSWEIDLFKSQRYSQTRRSRQFIARLTKILESLPPFYQTTDANSLEVQPILYKDFKALAQEE